MYNCSKIFCSGIMLWRKFIIKKKFMHYQKKNNVLKTKEKQSSNQAISHLQLSIMFIYLLTSLIALLAVSLITYSATRNATTEKISELISAESRQLELNIDSYLTGVERNATLLFSDPAYYAYDATDESLSEYDRIQAEKKITDRIVDLGLMENYSDFAIVYSNDKTVGWFSDTTSNLFVDGGIYDTFSGMIDEDNDKLDAWCFDLKGSRDSCYYVKRLNPNAVLVASFFSRELSDVFQLTDELDGMKVQLTDENGLIIYSSDLKEIGQELSKDILKNANTPEFQNHLLVDSNACSNGWQVYTSVSEEAVMGDIIKLHVRTIVIVFLLTLVVGIVGLLVVRNIQKSVGGIVGTLEEKATIDALSGAMNKAAFQTLVAAKLKNVDTANPALIMFDMDNFKSVNDTLGHKYGDEVIARFGSLLRDNLGQQYEIGRIGGDEFAAYIEFTDDRENVRYLIKKDVDSLKKDFDAAFEKEKESCMVSFSAGAAFWENGEGYVSLYQHADKALYQSKRSGKNKLSFYEKDMDQDSAQEDNEEGGTEE